MDTSNETAMLLTSSLQKDGSAREDTALQPSHAVAEIVEPDLLAPGALARARDGDLALGPIRERDLDHDPVTTAGASGPPGAAAIDLDVVVVQVLLEEAAPGGTRGRALHLPREVAAGEDRGALAEGVGDLLGVDVLQRHADTEAAAALVVVDQDELALLGVGNVREQALRGFVVVPGAVARGDGVVVR